MTALPSTYRPPNWLRNPHLQSTLASSRLRRGFAGVAARRLEQTAIERIVDCGDGVRLQGFLNNVGADQPSRGLAVLLHGWEGTVRSGYLVRSALALLDAGFDVFRLHFRDHGGSIHLNEALFHSCRLDEVVGAVAAIAASEQPKRLVVAGFSLGGNFALRVGLAAPTRGVAVDHVAAVCPVVRPTAGLAALESAPWFYHAHFMRKWRGSLRAKRALYPQRFAFSDLDLAESMREVTRRLVLAETDFSDLDAYLEGYSVADGRLSALSMPASVLTARDDPIIPIADFANLGLPPGSVLEIADHGGHCGFIIDRRLGSYAEAFLVRELTGEPGAGTAPLP